MAQDASFRMTDVLPKGGLAFQFQHHKTIIFDVRQENSAKKGTYGLSTDADFGKRFLYSFHQTGKNVKGLSWNKKYLFQIDSTKNIGYIINNSIPEDI